MMKHTTRMLLIPEDVYKELRNRYNVGAPEDVQLNSTAQAMSNIVGNAENMLPDARQIHFIKQQKLHQKLLAEREARPLPVTLPSSMTAASAWITPPSSPAPTVNNSTFLTMTPTNTQNAQSISINPTPSTTIKSEVLVKKTEKERPKSFHAEASNAGTETDLEKLTNYILGKRTVFGVTKEEKILNDDAFPIKGSSLSSVLAYMTNNDISNNQHKAPAGYISFYKRVQNDETFQKLLKKENRVQSGKGSVFKFKPVLWS